MKFLFSLSLVAFTGIFTCRASEVNSPVSFFEASRKFLKDFNGFNDPCCAGKRVAECKFKLSGPKFKRMGDLSIELGFTALENTFHWDKEKISILGSEGPKAWKLMTEYYLSMWFMLFGQTCDKMEPVVPATELECELFNAIGFWIMANSGSGPDLDKFPPQIEHLWSKLLEGGRMYLCRTQQHGLFAMPDVLITKYVHFLTACHLHPGEVSMPGDRIGDSLRNATVSDYEFILVDGAEAASTTHLFEEHQRSIHAPASQVGLPPALAGLFGLESSTKREAWAAVIARSRAARTSRCRTRIALAALAIVALAIVAFCLCSRKKKQDVARFDDLDAVVTVV